MTREQIDAASLLVKLVIIQQLVDAGAKDAALRRITELIDVVKGEL